MFRSAIWRAICLITLLVITPISALAQAKDTWTYQTPGDEFYFGGYETAAILQSDDSIAVLAFPKGETTMDAHIGFYANDFVTSMKSTLVDADGTMHSVLVEGENLKPGTLTESGFISYHFILNETDAAKFQHASIWRIETSVQTVTYSLKGSRIALDQVLAIRAKPKPASDDDGFTEYMVDECDMLAGHPGDKDKYLPGGVSWDALDGEAAASSCELAVLLNDDTANMGRLQYQLGRALDKIGDSEAYPVMTKAALDMRYPMAFNHLGLLLWDGDYAPQDLERARDLFELGTKMGSLSAQYSLGRFLIKEGDGSTDLNLAQGMLYSAAAAGHVLSQRTYGQHLVKGTFGAKDPAAALPYLARAADSGDATAAYDLAQLYVSGQGVKANPALYLDYLKLAARGGHAKAREELGFE